jgi:hypothetical protein
MAKRAKKASSKTGRKTKAVATASRSRPLPTHETRRIYRPDDIALSAAKLFPGQAKDWADVASRTGFLRIRPAVMQGIVGLFGSLALGNPPSPEDVEAWEASKPKDQWDYWALFHFISVPVEGKKGGLDVVIFHDQNSFQERPLEVAFRIHLPKTEAECFITDQSEEVSEASEKEVLEREWTRLRTALERKFGTADLKKQKWTVGGTVYDVTFPDD